MTYQRKPIQIAVIPETDDALGALYALCDDGTIWVRVDSKNPIWVQVDSIPQLQDKAT